jgi:hypothetical protein
VDQQRDLLLTTLVGGSPGVGEVHPDNRDRPEGLAHRGVHLSLHLSEFDLLGNYIFPSYSSWNKKYVSKMTNFVHEKMRKEMGKCEKVIKIMESSNFFLM